MTTPTVRMRFTAEELMLLRLAINYTSEAEYFSTSEDQTAEKLWRRLMAAQLTLVDPSAK
jgi:hypothetical protein